MNKITYEYFKEKEEEIEALVSRDVAANAIAAEAPTGALLHVRLMNEGFDLMDGTTDVYTSDTTDAAGNLARPDECLVVRGSKAYQVLRRNVDRVVLNG